MLYLVGLGLGDAKDITVKGLEIVKKADYVFLEAYTSILCVGKEVLVGNQSTNLQVISNKNGGEASVNKAASCDC